MTCWRLLVGVSIYFIHRIVVYNRVFKVLYYTLFHQTLWRVGVALSEALASKQAIGDRVNACAGVLRMVLCG